MNPYAQITVSDVISLEEHLRNSKYSAVVYGHQSFKQAVEVNNLCRSLNIPFYLLNTSGLFGFFYIDVGRELTFTHHRKATDTEEVHTIKDSRPLSEYMSQFQGQSSKLKWNKRLIFKNDKYLTLAIASLYLSELNEDDLIMSNQAYLDKIKDIITQNGLPETILENEDFKDILQRFFETYKIDFNPSASVIGAIVSQEIVKVITQRDLPSHGLAVYDSITERCIFE